MLAFLMCMYDTVQNIHVDFSEERNQLSRETFPLLQRYCQTLGLEFQVVDMRWGVRDENISYHQTSQVCIQEIQTCQRLSLGPSFLVCNGCNHVLCASKPKGGDGLLLNRSGLGLGWTGAFYIIDTYNRLYRSLFTGSICVGISE